MISLNLMSKTFKIIVPGKPMGKQRPKATIRGKHAGVYTPKETTSYENLVVAMYRQKYADSKPFEGMVKGTIIAYYQIPKSVSKKKQKMMLDGDIRPMTKPDLDNIEKIIYDALNGIAYTDDSHIIAQRCAKFYSETPRVEVIITEL